MRSNLVYALAGLGLVAFGMPALLFGIASLLGSAILGLIGISGTLLSFFQTLGILCVIFGAIGTWYGIRLVAQNSGKLIRRALGIIAILAAVLSAALAIISAIPTSGIGLFIFLASMVVLLIVSDWGIETEFFSKFIKAIPIIGNITVGIVKFALPKR